MSKAHSLVTLIAAHRPPDAPATEIAALGEIAWRWRDELALTLAERRLETLALSGREVDELAVAMTELAEDLHADNALWRALESANQSLFNTPLPLLWRAGDAPLLQFDSRRFQFFLHTLWRHFKPDHIVSPAHGGLMAVAHRAAAFFSAAFASHRGDSSVAAFLGTGNARGWDVKRKLVWLGTEGFLFRFAYADYLARNPPKDDERIAVTDDFLCQECTAWSGLGVLDLLAAVLELPDAERATLRGWHERHAAFFRVGEWHARGAEVETMTVVNLINEQPYRVRMEVPRARCPFAPGQMVFGMLVPWHGEWYWSGGQKCYAQVPPDVEALKRSVIEKSPRIAYRYRPDLAERARQSAATHRAAFVRFHGSDLAVFADGLTAAAALQKQWREQIEAKTGAELPDFLAKHGLDRSGPKLKWPRDLVECRRGVALFYHEGEGIEIVRDFDVLRAALGKSREAMTDAEAEVLQAFIESAEVSPAFARRVVREHGSAGLASLYFLPNGVETELKYLLRRFKGFYFRRRYPNISLLGAA